MINLKDDKVLTPTLTHVMSRINDHMKHYHTDLKHSGEGLMDIVALHKHPAERGQEEVVEHNGDGLTGLAVFRAIDAHKIDDLCDHEVDGQVQQHDLGQGQQMLDGVR